MILFPGISPKTITRVLFPFIINIAVIIAVIIAYNHYTDSINSNVVMMERERAIQTAKSVIGFSLNADISPEMFDSLQSNGFVYIDLKPEYLRSFNLNEFEIVSPMYGNASESFSFEEKSLAEDAIRNGSPTMRYVEIDKENGLLLFYPVMDSSRNNPVARMVFMNVLGNEIKGIRHNSILLVLVAALILLIAPCLLLMLADLRRQIEKDGIYKSDNVVTAHSRAETVSPNVCPSSFLDGIEFPALFRLDKNGEVVFINKTAEKLIDISKNDIRGMKFNKLPCFSTDESDLIEYPKKDEPLEHILGVIDSSDSSRKSVFRIEKLGGTGYIVSVRKIGNQDEELQAVDKSRTDMEKHVTSSGSLSNSDIQRIKAYIEEGRMKFQRDSAFLDQLNRIYDIVSGKEEYHENEELGKVETIEIFSELDAISAALNDVLPERASIELDVPGFLPQVECSRVDFTQVIKNMVFYSLESRSGSVRIKLGARDVPSPVSDSVFSANCDRTVSRSVSITYTDGTRMPVVLKEALRDPETDLSGIQRDYGSHISSVADVLSRLDCHPVFTEGSTGTTLNILFRISEDYLFDSSNTESPHRIDLSLIKLAICDSSRAVRESVSDVLTMYGMNVITAADLEEMKEMMTESEVDYLLLDHSAADEPIEEVVSDLRKRFPDIKIILSTGSSVYSDFVQEFSEPKVSLLKKPYSTDELLSIIEILFSAGSVPDNVMTGTGRNE